MHIVGASLATEKACFSSGQTCRRGRLSIKRAERMEDEPEAAEESVGTLKLCPPEDFMKLRREKAKEVKYSVLTMEKNEQNKTK